MLQKHGSICALLFIVRTLVQTVIAAAAYLSQTPADYDKTGSQYGRFFLWTTAWLYMPFQYARSWNLRADLERVAGPFDAPVISAVEVNV
jgi:hypothetical protein